MFKAAIVALGMIANGVSAASTCTATISTYSDSSCSTAKEILPLYENGVATVEFTFHQCWSKTGSSGDAYL